MTLAFCCSGGMSGPTSGPVGRPCSTGSARTGWAGVAPSLGPAAAWALLSTVGSPAEKGERGDVWVYLPERSAILVPSKALKLHFEDNRLSEFGFHAIVLGAQL